MKPSNKFFRAIFTFVLIILLLCSIVLRVLTYSKVNNILEIVKKEQSATAEQKEAVIEEETITGESSKIEKDVIENTIAERTQTQYTHNPIETEEGPMLNRFGLIEDTTKIETLLNTLPTLDGKNFLERYEEFNKKGYSFPSGQYYLNADYTSPAIEYDYLNSIGNILFKFEKDTIDICFHRDSNAQFDFVRLFSLLERVIYREGDTIIVEGIDMSRDYCRFELKNGTYLYSGGYNADLSNTNFSPLGTSYMHGTLALDETDFGLYYLGKKICSVKLPSTKISASLPNLHDELFYERPFICGENLMYVITYKDWLGNEKMHLQLLDKNVARVIEADAKKMGYHDLWILQYTDGSYGILQFKRFNEHISFVYQYCNSDFNNLDKTEMLTHNTFTIRKLTPEEHFRNLHFNTYFQGNHFCGINIVFDVYLDDITYLNVNVIPDNLYCSRDNIDISPDECKALFLDYVKSFSIEEYDAKLSKVEEILNKLKTPN